MYFKRQFLLLFGISLVSAILEPLLSNGSAANNAPIVFVSRRDGNPELHAMDADGGNRTRLTNHRADDLSPTWSPDGKRIAYASGNGIYVMDSDGKNQRKLTNVMGDGRPTWSPESDGIAFQSFRDGGPGIYTIDVRTRIIHTLVPVLGLGGVEPDWFYPGQLPVDRTGNHVTIWGRLKKIASSVR